MPVPTPALLTLQHNVVLTLHFIWVPKAVALLTEQTASENTALLTSRHQSKVNKYGRYPNTAIRRRFLSALFRSRPRYRRNKTCVHGRSSAKRSCLVRKAPWMAPVLFGVSFVFLLWSCVSSLLLVFLLSFFNCCLPFMVLLFLLSQWTMEIIVLRDSCIYCWLVYFIKLK